MKLANLSIDYTFDLYELSDTSMIGRVGILSVGYFYDYIYLDSRNHISGIQLRLLIGKSQ